MNDQQRLLAEKKKDRIFTYVILGICAINYFNTSKALDNSRTVISPFGSVDSGDYWVTATNASDSYIGRLAQLVLSYYSIVSPASVDNSYNVLLSMTHPLRSEFMRGKLEERKTKIKNFTTVSFTSEINSDRAISITKNAKVDYPHGKESIFRVMISVTNKQIIGNKVNDAETSTLTIDYIIENGKFWLMDING